jgi:hypothetical protein
MGLIIWHGVHPSDPSSRKVIFAVLIESAVSVSPDPLILLTAVFEGAHEHRKKATDNGMKNFNI